MQIRSEQPADIPSVRKVVEAAFPQPVEARLVDQLRADGDTVLAAVAVEQAGIVGHAVFSKMAAPFRALGLGPVAVAPPWQRKGIGSQLVRWGLERVAEAGWQGVFVLGDPWFYRRFGFDAALARDFTSQFAGAHLMVLPLGGPLPAVSGVIDYAPAFWTLG